MSGYIKKTITKQWALTRPLPAVMPVSTDLLYKQAGGEFIPRKWV